MPDALPQTFFQRLIDESLDAVIIIDEHAIIRYLNPAMQALSGYAPGELLGQSLNGLLPEHLAAHHDAYLQRYLGSGRASTVLGQVREFAIRHRTGAMIPIEMKALDLGRSDGKRIFGAFMIDRRAQREMQARNQALLARLEREALADPLTGLPNRRAFEAETEHAIARARRGGGPVAIGIADIDHFKRVNDDFGHPAGDAVLRQVAGIIARAARSTDVVARIGGEEFGLLLPYASPEQAHHLAERIRLAVAGADIATGNGASIRITISIGLSALATDSAVDAGAALHAALTRADAALYLAKNGGRNRVESHHGEGGASPPATPILR